MRESVNIQFKCLFKTSICTFVGLTARPNQDWTGLIPVEAQNGLPLACWAFDWGISQGQMPSGHVAPVGVPPARGALPCPSARGGKAGGSHCATATPTVMGMKRRANLILLLPRPNVPLISTYSRQGTNQYADTSWCCTP